MGLKRRADRFGPTSGVALFRGGLQMRQGLFGMLGCDVGVFQLAMLDGGLQMRNAFGRMRIRLRLLGRLGMRQRRFGMGYEQIGVALFSMHNGFFGMTDSFGQMVLGQGEAWRESESGSKTKNQRKCPAIHDVIPPVLSFPRRLGKRILGAVGRARQGLAPTRAFSGRLTVLYNRAHFRA